MFERVKRRERVPVTLQTVLVIGNRGKEVTKAPPNRVAARTFGSAFGRRRKDTTVVTDGSTASGNSSKSFGAIKSPLTTNSAPIPEIVSISSAATTDARPAAASPSSSNTVPNTRHHVSPQVYLTSLLKNRGYSGSSIRYTAYQNEPSSLQVASHGVCVVEAVRSNDFDTLRELMEVGLSPNACNEHGESIVHMACRMGWKDSLRVLLDHGCSVRVADNCGRTPLHDACWSAGEPDFELIDMILDQDPRLLCVQDMRGALPLTYLQEAQWTAWTKFLMSRKDRYWPERDVAKLGVEPPPPTKTTATLPDPPNALSAELAKMVAQGRIAPSEAALLKGDGGEGSSEDDGTSCFSSECDSSEYEFDFLATSTSEDDDDWSESAFDDNEMKEILGRFGKGQALDWSF